jgi:Protein of unknown function (DUF2637)
MVKPALQPAPTPAEQGTWARVGLVWVAGLIVALGAGVATAHGLYEVALAAGTPRALAWLYPLITDGLALVAYATTTRLAESGCRYAWTVVVTAAALSGLTQASYLAGGVATAPPVLRFAIGAWPAIAAAIVAHLLYLLGADHPPTHHPDRPAAAPAQPAPVTLPVPTAAPHPALDSPPPTTDRADPKAKDSTPTPAGQPEPRQLVQALTSTPIEHGVEHPAPPPQTSVVRTPVQRDTAPARIRAQTAATGHATRHGQLPTVSELMALAQVARGTAATALKDLRTQQEQTKNTTTTTEARTNR